MKVKESALSLGPEIRSLGEVKDNYYDQISSMTGVDRDDVKKVLHAVSYFPIYKEHHK